MPRAAKPKKHLILADALEAWAKKYGYQEDAYASGLLDALRNNKNLDVWSSLNPLDYLPIPAVRAGAKLQGRTRLLTVIRNVLVFAPVALTWVAVGEATTGFAEYLATNTTTVANFLDFWQNGYGILHEEYRIANIARLDAIIIFIVIALTLIASLTGKRATDMTNRAEILADRERMVIAVEIASFLHTKRTVSTVTMNQSLVSALNRLLNATDSLETTTKLLEKATKEAKAVKAVKAVKVAKRESPFANFEYNAFDSMPARGKASKSKESPSFDFSFSDTPTVKKKLLKWPRRESS
ncbi:MAG: hypothetical protein QNL72_03315 [Candidatus Planktophila sp.]